MSPWIARNYAQLHAVFWMRDNFGLELHTSNNPEARPLETDNREGTGSFRIHPNGQPGACAEVQRIGEAVYFKLQQREALDWIGSQPVAFVKLSLARMFYFWLVPLNSTIKRLASAVLTLFTLTVLAAMWRNRPARLLALILLAYSAIYYVIQVDPRFRYPMHPLLLTGAAGAAFSAMGRIRTQAL